MKYIEKGYRVDSLFIESDTRSVYLNRTLTCVPDIYESIWMALTAVARVIKDRHNLDIDEWTINSDGIAVATIKQNKNNEDNCTRLFVDLYYVTIRNITKKEIKDFNECEKHSARPTGKKKRGNNVK